MDLETDVKNLLEEEAYVDELLKALNELKNRKGYKYLLEDTIALIDKLKDKKTRIKKELDDISNEMISVAEAFAGVDFAALDAELM